MQLFSVSLLVCGLLTADVDDLLKQARAALQQGKAQEALTLLNQAIARDADNPQAYLLRGIVHEAQEEHDKAVADFSKTIQLDPKAADAYNRRGSEQFKLGKIKESIDDFDQFLALRPQEAPAHWKRGISYFYVRRFADGQKQFEGYQDVDANDVENAVWRFLCMVPLVGVDKARGDMLQIGKDKRVPMMEVYDLYLGKIKPEDVLAAATAGQPNAESRNRQLFYAHLYLGLYYEVMGDARKAYDHLNRATDQHKIGHYMWDVARVHRDLLKAKMQSQ
ncbi:MAG: tetratricopeptide repeat protein [Gemmataceae bacterium]